MNLSMHKPTQLLFFHRYVEKVPLAAELLDLRETQKLNMVETLKTERQRVRFEAAIGKAPPLTDEELMEHIREEAYVNFSLVNGEFEEPLSLQLFNISFYIEFINSKNLVLVPQMRTPRTNGRNRNALVL